MIDGHRLSKYLDNTNLMAEEFYQLYRLMLQEQNIANGILKLPGNKSSGILEFSQLSEKYEQTHKERLNLIIDWDGLEAQGFIEIWADKNATTRYKLTELKVTDKFKSIFLISDIEHAFYELLEIYPTWVWIKGMKFPAQDKKPEELARLYDEHILKGGNALLHERCLLITQKYLESRDKKSAPYKLSNYIIDAYHGIADAIEKESYEGDPFSIEI